MTKTKQWILLLVAISMILSGCKIRDANAGPDRNVKTCKDTNRRFKRAYEALKLPDHLRQEEPTRLPTDFELRRFLDMFDGLKVNESYLVDYVYSYRNIGGKPLLYSLYGSKVPYKTEKEYEAGKPLPFTMALETDDTARGYLELAMVDLLAPNFYLYFHAIENDDVVLCNIDDIENLLDDLESIENITQPNMLVQARALTMDRIEPTVVIDAEAKKATITLLSFSKWGGFYRHTYVFDTVFPHERLEHKKELLIEYDSEFRY